MVTGDNSTSQNLQHYWSYLPYTFIHSFSVFCKRCYRLQQLPPKSIFGCSLLYVPFIKLNHPSFIESSRVSDPGLFSTSHNGPIIVIQFSLCFFLDRFLPWSLKREKETTEALTVYHKRDLICRLKIQFSQGFCERIYHQYRPGL